MLWSLSSQGRREILHIPIFLKFWSEFEQKKAIWATKQLYKQRNKNGDNWLLEKLFVLFIQDWKLHAIVDNNLFWKVEN